MDKNVIIVLFIATMGCCVCISSSSAIAVASASSNTITTTTTTTSSPDPSSSGPAIDSIGYVIDTTKTYKYTEPGAGGRILKLDVDTSTNKITLTSNTDNVFSSLIYNYTDPNNGTYVNITPSYSSPSPGSSTSPLPSGINPNIVQSFFIANIGIQMLNGNRNQQDFNHAYYSLKDGITIASLKFK
jgi:hypothetical protein